MPLCQISKSTHKFRKHTSTCSTCSKSSEAIRVRCPSYLGYVLLTLEDIQSPISVSPFFPSWLSGVKEREEVGQM